MARKKEVVPGPVVQAFGQALAAKGTVPLDPDSLQTVYQAAITATFQVLLSDGSVTLPDGWGVFRLKRKAAEAITAPDGTSVTLGPRPKITYTPGKAVKAALD